MVVQEEDPAVDVVPGGQVVQLDASDEEYVPAEHEVHPADPATEEYVPAEHEVQTVAPEGEYFPAAHNPQVSSVPEHCSAASERRTSC